MARGEDEKGDGIKRRFAAFISYSHADDAAAAKLQRKLERYRLPKHIIAAHGRENPVLGRIFRDREDLAAATNLTDAIRAAIADAEALIVVCSPDAAKSQWVTAEIILFRELHPDRPVLAAIVSGDPADAFPGVLTENGREPLAADLRAVGDGGSLGFLKIVAGIAGVPLDALVQRDAQRRVRRVTAITLVTSALVLVMGIMTAFAIQSRNEAARQRAASDGLVAYMLTDLRQKLKGVGRGEIMSAINQRALQHYSDQGDLQRLPDESLEHRARVLHAMGEDAELALDHALASKLFRQSHHSTAALLRRDPGNPDRIFAHAQSEFYLGMFNLNRRDRVAATPYFQGYLDQAKALAKIEPDSFRSHMELGFAEGNLCDLNVRDSFDIGKAKQHCLAAIRHEQNALRLMPNDAKTRQDLANRWGWLARVQILQKNWDGALESRRKEVQLLDTLIDEDPQNVEYAIRRSWSTTGLARVLIEKGERHEARALLGKALPEFERKMRGVTGDARVADSKARMLGYLGRAEKLEDGTVSARTSEMANAIFVGENAPKLSRIYNILVEKGD